ncbi:WYL domain-containing protein [Nocardia sp. NPDC050717]|uniref:helix-turn-helix transcriptional regulator n=1 Tax=Nocardia sp. NPDC050717 TaxID=3157221 RepID=UPI0033ED9925
MADTAHRALRLLSLLGSGRRWPLRELAARLEVSERTVRRDVETLRRLDYPISTVHGPDGGYRLGGGHTLPPLLFDNDQALAVAVALQTAPRTTFGLGDDAARALATLHQVLPPASRAAMESMRLTRLRNYWEFPAPPLDPAALTAVGTAVRHRHVLATELLRPDGTRPAPGEPDFRAARRLEPHHLVVWAGRWYVVAYDLADDEWRVHRVDRLHVRPTTQRFAARAVPGDDLAHLVMSTHDRGDTLAAGRARAAPDSPCPPTSWPGGRRAAPSSNSSTTATPGSPSAPGPGRASPASSPPSTPISPTSGPRSSSTPVISSHAA